MQGDISVSVLVTTKNEERNLARCLQSLERFKEIIVVDSDSHDGTVKIAESFGVPVVNFTWNGRYPKKRQWCLDTLDLKYDRVFFIDADEEATPALCDEIAALDWRCAGYFVKGLYVRDGELLRFGMHNKKLCLFDRREIEFPVVDDLDIPGMGEIEGHYQPVLKKGLRKKTGSLRNHVLHHALEDMERYRARHDGYALWRGVMSARNSFPKDPVAARQFLKKLFWHMPCKKLFLFVHYYFIHLGFLEGKKNVDVYREKMKYYGID